MKKYIIELNLNGSWESINERKISAASDEEAVFKMIKSASLAGAKFVSGLNIRAVEA